VPTEAGVARIGRSIAAELTRLARACFEEDSVTRTGTGPIRAYLANQTLPRSSVPAVRLVPKRFREVLNDVARHGRPVARIGPSEHAAQLAFLSAGPVPDADFATDLEEVSRQVEGLPTHTGNSPSIARPDPSRTGRVDAGVGRRRGSWCRRDNWSELLHGDHRADPHRRVQREACVEQVSRVPPVNAFSVELARVVPVCGPTRTRPVD
jgi:hypothetical protein